LKSKVGKGFRVGRGGRSLRDRSALAGRGLGSKGISAAPAAKRAKSSAPPPSL
jgi:hypothetical protein